jgi:hypothetical protein
MACRLQAIAGFTLTEILLSTAISVVVLFSIMAIDISRVSIQEDARDNAGIAFMSQTEAALVAREIKHGIETADRVQLINGGNGIQIRRMVLTGACAPPAYPAASCFDDPANFQWTQYSVDAGGDIVRFVDTGAGCPAAQVLVRNDNNAVGLSFVSDPDGSGLDNVIRYTIQWTHPDTGQQMNFTGDAVIRVSAVGTGGRGSSATILAAPAVCN